jgi:hypothetical protein
MIRAVSDRARQFATELERLFAQDTDLAHTLNDAHRRLLDANNRLWSGVHPDGLRAVYGDHLESECMQLASAGSARSQVLDSSDALDAVQEAHWEIHEAHCDYQEVAESRGRLAVDAGETIRAFVDELVTAGWSDQEARDLNVHELASSPRWRGLGHDDSKLANGNTSRAGAAGQDASSEQDMESAP